MSMSGSPVYSNIGDEADLRGLGFENQVEFLGGAFFRLNKEQGVANAAIAKVELKTSSIDNKLSSLEATMLNLASSVQAMMKSVGKEPLSDEDQQIGSSATTSHLPRSRWDQNRGSPLAF